MLPDDMILTLAHSRPALTNDIKPACWQYNKILILGWGIMYWNREYVFETKPVLEGAERLKEYLKDLDFRRRNKKLVTNSSPKKGRFRGGVLKY
jgi:hypothetical protein